MAYFSNKSYLYIKSTKDFRSQNATSFKKTTACLSVCWLSKSYSVGNKEKFTTVKQRVLKEWCVTVKYCEHAKRTNLCTLIDWPSAASTTSTRLSRTSNESRTDTSVLWWLFHLRQNSWMSWLPIVRQSRPPVNAYHEPRRDRLQRPQNPPCFQQCKIIGFYLMTMNESRRNTGKVNRASSN